MFFFKSCALDEACVGTARPRENKSIAKGLSSVLPFIFLFVQTVALHQLDKEKAVCNARLPSFHGLDGVLVPPNRFGITYIVVMTVTWTYVDEQFLSAKVIPRTLCFPHFDSSFLTMSFEIQYESFNVQVALAICTVDDASKDHTLASLVRWQAARDTIKERLENNAMPFLIAKHPDSFAVKTDGGDYTLCITARIKVERSTAQLGYLYVRGWFPTDDIQKACESDYDHGFYPSSNEQEYRELPIVGEMADVFTHAAPSREPNKEIWTVIKDDDNDDDSQTQQASTFSLRESLPPSSNPWETSNKGSDATSQVTASAASQATSGWKPLAEQDQQAWIGTGFGHRK